MKFFRFIWSFVLPVAAFAATIPVGALLRCQKQSQARDRLPLIGPARNMFEIEV